MIRWPMQLLENKNLRGRVYAKVSKREIYFSAATVKKFNLLQGCFLHIMEEENFWLCYQDLDNSGFKLCNQDYGLRICSQVLVHQLKLEVLPTVLKIEKTGTRYEGKPVFKIIL